VATINAIRAKLRTMRSPEIASVHSELMNLYPLRYRMTVSHDQPQEWLIDKVLEYAGDRAVKDDIAVLLGLQPDADEQAERDEVAKNAAVESAKSAKRSVTVSIAAVVIALIALFKDSIATWLGW